MRRRACSLRRTWTYCKCRCFLDIFVVVVIQLAGITPVVVEIVFYFGECVRFVVNAFVPVVAQIGIARQVQCHAPVVGLGVFALIEAAQVILVLSPTDASITP